MPGLGRWRCGTIQRPCQSGEGAGIRFQHGPRSSPDLDGQASARHYKPRDRPVCSSGASADAVCWRGPLAT